MHGSPVSHELQAAPPEPHWVVDWEENGTHFPSTLQQPSWQEVSSQAHCPVIVSHFWPDLHAAQLAPPMPHWFADCDACNAHSPAAVQHPSTHVFGVVALGTPYNVMQADFSG